MCNRCNENEFQLVPELNQFESYETGAYQYEGAPAKTQKAPKAHVDLGDPVVSNTANAEVVRPGPCQTNAVNLIPKYLEPKLITCFNTVIPSVQTEPLFRKTLEANIGLNWITKLNTDLQTFWNYLYPKVNLTVELWRTVIIPRQNMRSFIEPLRNYLLAKGNKYTVSIIAPLSSQKTIENAFKIWLDPVVAKGGALPKPPYNYYWHVYATFPDSVKNNFRQVDWVDVDKFEFNKYTITSAQQKMITNTALDIVESWLSSSTERYEAVALEGHTDIRGTETNNMVLGKNRATAVAKALQAEINRIAPGYYLDPTKMKIRFDITSLGKTKPISKKQPIQHELNRRVEIKLYSVKIPAQQPIDLDAVLLRCLRIVKSQRSLDKETAQRLLCLLTTMQNKGVDDRYIAGSQAILNIYNGAANPTIDEWSKVRFQLTQVNLFGPQVPSEQVLRSLLSVDESIRAAIREIDRITTYNAGIPMNGAVMSTPLVPILNWVKSQANKRNSIYYCYR